MDSVSTQQATCENEFRIFGPPGCGKTTYLVKQVQTAVEKHGADSLIIASFTRTAAAELASRDLPIEANRCGTLHAHCYHAIGRPEIAETHVKEFNEENKIFTLSDQRANVDEAAVDQTFGGNDDEIFAKYQILRARMVHRDMWPQSVQGFATAWEKWKAEHNYIDFTDMIEIAKRDIKKPPHNATIGIFDEVQDFTPLQLSLIREWGKHLNFFLLAGDDDQTLYTFTGATPNAFLNPTIDARQKKILAQSYRVPSVVQKLAQRWIKQIGRREEKEYNPRPYEGEIIQHSTPMSNTDSIIELASKYEREGKTVMILAACGYMLSSVVGGLKEAGIPFHNPYRTTRGDWNPLGAKRGMSTKERIVSYLKPAGPMYGDVQLWSIEQLAAWVELCHTKGMLVTNGKKRITEAMAKGVETSNELFSIYTQNFQPAALDEAIMLSPDFIKSRLTAKVKTAPFIFKVIEERGVDSLYNPPKICVGTIHSVKGGQADVVIIAPDLSMNGNRAYLATGTEEHESVIRQFYVGITRCRETLVVCQPGGSWAVGGLSW